ncbi:hypothetical protein CVIRNUC_005017 [Coccomyxa viridis]|uniref:Transmembrane protein n=1 Tax=Coccomyxa viridis TaxID=1274662 RepID=A0AAV1I460_9CHLO|nr:hypothetical protein CVIRNUC_005017 [Coccomyxa viridis]
MSQAPGASAVSAAAPAASPLASPRQPQTVAPVLGTSPPPPFFSQTDQYQAAKYFTFIFFGLSVFVILLFGGFVLCHCYRRLRYDRDNDSGPQGSPGPQGPSRRRNSGNIEIPVKQGFVVQNPDGGINVAYIPDATQPARQASGSPKALPGTPASVGRLPGSPRSSAQGTPDSASASGSSSALAGTQGVHAGCTHATAGRRGEARAPSDASASEASSAGSTDGRRGWPRMVFSSPASAPGRSGDVENQLPQPRGQDTAWRQRQAGLFHMF